MMAGHPNGVSMLSLRNVPFALQVGGGRLGLQPQQGGQGVRRESSTSSRPGDPKGYPHFVKIHEGKGHWMNLEDKVALPWMAKFTRNPVPEKVVWKQTGTPHERSYWLAVPPGEAKTDTLVVAERGGQKVEITSVEKVGKLLVRLDDRMADLDKPVTITHGGKELFAGTPAADDRGAGENPVRPRRPGADVRRRGARRVAGGEVIARGPRRQQGRAQTRPPGRRGRLPRRSFPAHGPGRLPRPKHSRVGYRRIRGGTRAGRRTVRDAPLVHPALDRDRAAA